MTMLLKGHLAAIRGIAFSPTNRWLASGDYSGEIRLWDLTTSTYKILQPPLRAAYGVGSLAFSPDGTLLVAGPMDQNDYLSLFNVDTQKEIGRHEANEIECLAFNPDGSLFACCGQEVSLRDGKTGVLHNVLGAHKDWVLCAAWSADAAWLATGAYNEDSTIRIWDIATGTLEAVSEEPNDYAWAIDNLTFQSIDTIVCTGEDMGPHIWHWRTERSAKLLWPNLDGYPSALSENGRYLAQIINEVPDTNFIQHYMDDMYPNYLNDADYCTLRIANLQTGSCEYWHGRAQHYDTLTRIVFSSDGQKVATADVDGNLYVWAVSSFSP